MATAPAFNVDNRVKCNVCSQPFRGKKPKLLPCFHSVCLRCLEEITQYGQASSTAQVTGQSTATVTCPTCGSKHDVPHGGVGSFQTNFYIDDGDSPDVLEEEDARKSRDQQGGNIDEGLLDKVNDQIRIFTAITVNLRKEDEEIDRQRQVVEEQIDKRYETGVRLLGENRHACLLTLKAASQQVKDKVQAEMDTTLLSLSSLQAFADDVAAGTSASKSKPRPPLLSDAALRHFQHLSDSTEKPAVFSYTWSHNTEVVMDSVREFMGSVSVAGISPESDSSRTDSKERSSAINTQPINTAVSCSHATQPLALRSDLTQLREDLTGAIDQVKQDITSTSNHLKHDLTSANDQLKQDITSANTQLKDDLTSANTQLKDDLMSANKQLKDDLMSANKQLKDDLTSANDQLKQDVKKDVSDCERDVVVLQQSQTHTEKLMTDLQEQMGKLNTPVFFNTQLSKDTVFPFRAKMVMDKVLANTGGGYDVTTGVFTAPLTGTYLFMATTKGDSDKRCLKETGDGVAFHIIVEGKDVASSWCCGITSCTAHAVVRLHAGHKVWLQALYTGRARGDGYNSFSGVLTHPEL